MAKCPLATLLTDFGTRDPYVAAMKGVMLGICPGAQLVDICHDVPAHDVLAAAFILAQAAPYYPPGTLHVVVVDPGVGTGRQIMAGRFGGQVFLFPDNGVISFVAQAMPLEEIVTVRSTKYLPAAGVSMTFHGRDIFAPIAGGILNGLDIGRLGPRPETYKLLDLPVASEDAGGLAGQIVYVDRFGNLISNIPEQLVRRRFADLDRLRITCAGRDAGPLQGAYGLAAEGEPLCLFNSMGLLEVAVNRRRASELLGVGIGAPVTVTES